MDRADFDVSFCLGTFELIPHIEISWTARERCAVHVHETASSTNTAETFGSISRFRGSG